MQGKVYRGTCRAGSDIQGYIQGQVYRGACRVRYTGLHAGRVRGKFRVIITGSGIHGYVYRNMYAGSYMHGHVYGVIHRGVYIYIQSHGVMYISK